MSFDDELKALRATHGANGERLADLARAALAEQREEQALPLVATAARKGRNARLWQWKGLLERALDEHAEAVESFRQASALAPGDASIAHGAARVALEAGLPAVNLFIRALQLAPADAQVYLGLNAARIAEGRSEEAEADLDQVLERSPLWLDGHQQLAQIRALIGKRHLAFASLDRAIASNAAATPLWQTLCELQVLGDEFELLKETLRRARQAGVQGPALAAYDFIAASELGETARADELLASGEAAAGPIWSVRHFMRNGELDQASAIVDAELTGGRPTDILPYAQSLWRLTGDPRLDWLAGPESLVSVIDLGDELAAIRGLAERLRTLHDASGRYLDQSVRGGSQTDGPLFSRIEPEIRALRALIVKAVQQHTAGLQSLPDGHPQKLNATGRKIRFTGSWSVRLMGQGFHTSHVHPQGWISSALYVSLPEQLDEGEGWLTLGDPPAELGLQLPPSRMVEPKVGRLVLFPSWMFHGTRPFRAGERLTVAFDVAPPAEGQSSSSS